MAVVLWESVIVVVFQPDGAATRVLDQMSPAVTLFVVALGIPIGFVMNQVYFTVYDGLRPRMPFLPVPLDRGGDILRNLQPDQRRHVEEAINVPIAISEELVTTRRRKSGRYTYRLIDNSPRGRRVYADRRKDHWRAVLWLMLNGLEPEQGDRLRVEYGTRADTYHALGGCRFAVLTAFLTTVAYNAVVHWNELLDEWLRSIVCLAVIAAGSAFLLVVLTQARANTLRVMQDLLKDSLRTCAMRGGT
jgi:hypothetical protein